jgi:hypothetical protein
MYLRGELVGGIVGVIIKTGVFAFVCLYMRVFTVSALIHVMAVQEQLQMDKDRLLNEFEEKRRKLEKLQKMEQVRLVAHSLQPCIDQVYVSYAHVNTYL